MMWPLWIVAGWLFAGAVVLYVIYFRSKTLRMTSTARGRVVGSEERVVRDATTRREETLVTCQYTVGGHDYVTRRIFNGKQAVRFPTGSELPIRYNPQDPTMSKIAIR